MLVPGFPIDLLGTLCLVTAPWVGRLAARLAVRADNPALALWGKSSCDACGARQSLRDQIPIVSFLIRRGLSRCCAKPLGLWSMTAELTALVLTIWALVLAEGVMLAASVLLGWTLLALSLIDIKTFRLPDPGTLGLVVAGLALSVAGFTGPVWWHAAGVMFGYGMFAAVGWAWHRFRGIDALGLGDAKLLAAAGAWVGLAGVPSLLIVASVAGLLHAAALGIGRGRWGLNVAIPFGPSLALGFWITWLYGPLTF